MPILDPDEAWALVAAPDAQLLVDADQLEYLRQAVVDRTEGFTIEELELLSADMCAIVNARRLDWDRRAMIDVRRDWFAGDFQRLTSCLSRIYCILSKKRAMYTRLERLGLRLSDASGDVSKTPIIDTRSRGSQIVERMQCYTDFLCRHACRLWL